MFTVWTELLIDPIAHKAEQWVVTRRINRYREKAAIFQVEDRYNALIEAGIQRAAPDPIDFSAIRMAYSLATQNATEQGLAAFDRYFGLRE